MAAETDTDNRPSSWQNTASANFMQFVFPFQFLCTYVNLQCNTIIIWTIDLVAYRFVFRTFQLG